MSYNPHHYKHLFPKGLFGIPNEKLVDWGESHRLFALNAQKKSKSQKTIAPGLIMKTGHIKQGPGFSNYLIFEIDPKIRDIQVNYSPKMVYPVDVYKTLNSPLVLLNLGYFYLTDQEDLDPVKPPKVRTCNMVITHGKIINLPILNRSAFVSLKNGTIKLAFVRAKGLVEIAGKNYSWVGSKTEYSKQDQVVVYNSTNIKIIRVIDPVMGPSRTAQEIFVKPHITKKLLIITVNNGRMKVADIKTDKTPINNLDMILEANKSLPVSKGQKIIFKTIDEFKIRDVQSAISIGPMIFKDEQMRQSQILKETFHKDFFLGNNPHIDSTKMARGCLVILSAGKMAAIFVDGIPQAGEIYPGVTPKELADFVKKTYPNYVVAVCTDPSSTMKVIYKDGKKTQIFGNLHYLHHKKLKNGVTKFWPSEKKGRKINSMLVIR